MGLRQDSNSCFPQGSQEVNQTAGALHHYAISPDVHFRPGAQCRTIRARGLKQGQTQFQKFDSEHFRETCYFGKGAVKFSYTGARNVPSTPPKCCGLVAVRRCCAVTFWLVPSTTADLSDALTGKARPFRAAFTSHSTQRVGR